MRKLRLTLDRLAVDSFPTSDLPPADPGTVKAHLDEPSAPHTCGCPTYHHTCGGQFTCYNTCDCPSWSGPECKGGCIG